MWGALSDERTGLSFARVTVSNKSVVSMYNLHLPFDLFHFGPSHYHTGQTFLSNVTFDD
jgi:hypothetical protein